MRNDRVQPSILYPAAKRLLDTLMALTGAILLLPFWIIVGLAIIIEDGFPVFIKQERIGRSGKVFRAFKLRSMHKSELGAKVNHQAQENDPRVTKVGKLLRRTALDESPQLLNILRGEMSFVGPRPLLTSEVELNGSKEIDVRKIAGYEQRISVIPGLTGIAQVYAPRDVTRHRKFEYDIDYIRCRCLLTDMKLILMSLAVTFLGRWETRREKLRL